MKAFQKLGMVTLTTVKFRRQAAAEALLRETASLLAASLLLDRERFRLEERRLAIEAAQLAARIDRDRRLAGQAGAN